MVNQWSTAHRQWELANSYPTAVAGRTRYPFGPGIGTSLDHPNALLAITFCVFLLHCTIPSLYSARGTESNVGGNYMADVSTNTRRLTEKGAAQISMAAAA